jgi:hypothetical protein
VGRQLKATISPALTRQLDLDGLEMVWASLVADGDFEMMDQPFVWHF